jgi:penicillin-binding protein 2
VEGIDICGKTGTAENFAKIGGVRVKMEDHSIFVAFAPKDNPKIAIAVMVENGGYGATIAGPIASLMIEKYLRQKITRVDLEKRILATSLQSRYAKLGGLSEAVKLQLRISDSLLKKKTTIPTVKAKTDTTKSNKQAI